MLTPKQVAERLNVDVSTIYGLCGAADPAKRLPHVRIGLGRGTIRISEEALDRYLESAARATAAPPSPAPRRATPAMSPERAAIRARAAAALERAKAGTPITRDRA